MTAAKIMDIISRLPGCDGQAADAVSAYTQVKMEDAHKLNKFPNRSVQTFGFVHYDTNGLNLGPVWKTQSFLLSEICMVILQQDCYVEGKLRKSIEIRLGEGSHWECLFVHREKGLFSSVYVDDIKLAGKEQNINPMWKVLNKEVDLGEPTPFLDHENLGCTQTQSEISKDIIDNYRTMFESRISAEQLKNYHARKICVSLGGPMTWKVMPTNVWNDVVSWQTKRLNNSTKYQLHALMTIISKKKSRNPWYN